MQTRSYSWSEIHPCPDCGKELGYYIGQPGSPKVLADLDAPGIHRHDCPNRPMPDAGQHVSCPCGAHVVLYRTGACLDLDGAPHFCRAKAPEPPVPTREQLRKPPADQRSNKPGDVPI